jgi:thymidylate synthase
MRELSEYNDNYIMRDYDNALSRILHSGFDIDGDRTGVGTRCVFGINTEYDISKRVPVLTKRKVAWQSIVKEVLWYISGSHNINDLEAMGAKIWTPWKNQEFTNKYGLPEGSGGYIYGFNLIHYGANLGLVDASKKYGTYEEHPDWHGFNQLDYVIETLRKNPKDRQACFTFWRPDTNHMAILPACHAFYHFLVSPNSQGEMNVLNCHVFQRSNDYPIGVGMGNLLTGTLFVYLIAQQLNMVPGKLYHSGSHCQIYYNALDSVREYVSRKTEPNSPILHVNKRDSIYDYVPSDFELSDYNPLSAIKFPIAV